MPLQTLPGATGYLYKRVSSMDNRAIGKLTDTNHLYSLHSSRPADYDKKIISTLSCGSPSKVPVIKPRRTSP